jgi:uncharacterized glyoxalase superfamily protein PhnB
MKPLYKPANYSTVSPYLIVNGAEATIEFLKRVFGAIELRRFPDESGKLMHAEVRIEDTVIMLADPAPPEWPPMSSYVHIYVCDVDATYRKALEAGTVSVQEPVKKQDEDKRGGIRDAGGTTCGSRQRSSSSPPSATGVRNATVGGVIRVGEHVP